MTLALAPQKKNVQSALLLLAALFTLSSALTPTPVDTTATPLVRESDSSAVTVPDSTLLPDSLTQTAIDTTDSLPSVGPSAAQAPANKALSGKKTSIADTAQADTSKLINGRMFGGEVGWSLGSFELTDYWERALPDSLGSFSLSSYSYALTPDSTSTDPVLFSDTAALLYKIKEEPSIYTMSFPLAFSFVSLTDTRRLTFSLRGAWMKKVQTAAISFKNDTTDAIVDYRQSINIYSLFLSATRGSRIPAEYFSVDGIERCYFITGIDLAPFINARMASNTTSPSGNERLKAVASQCTTPTRSLYGGAAGFRVGISMLKRINTTNATDVSACYTMQGYGYFFEDGNRVSIKDIDPAAGKKDRSLFWITNRFEIAITFLKLHHQ